MHSFDTLLKALSTRCRVVYRFGQSDSTSTCTQLIPPNVLQRRALELLGLMKPVPSN